VAATRPAGAAAEPFLRQQIRHIELAADRRQQEGEELVRRAEAALAATLSPESHDQARRGARARVAALVDANWPAIDPLRDYYALLAGAPLLRHLADGLFDRDELALLTAPTPAARTIDLADLPAIHYLFVLSQDPEVVGRTGHEHVVVDEAQDVSELDLLCLRRLERRHRFTLLGDLAQSIYAHRGLTSWAQAEAIFAGAPYRYEECAVGYRTTAEITALANRVLASIARLQDAPSSRVRSARPALAQTVDRHGPPPSLTAAADEAELVAAVAGAVAGARERRYASIAIITKTAGRARHLAAGLKQAGVPDVALAAAPDFEYRGGVVLLPVHLAKGLEFDAAVVVDADANTYPATPFDGRLLYVALTRALHALHAIWTGHLSPHLLP
jgi:DNA helicase-2/ATP-dependent DNA helicase PcrA